MNRANGAQRRGEVGLAFAVATLLAGCGSHQAKESPAGTGSEVVVRTEAVIDTAVARPVHATGTLSAKEEIPLSFKIGGVIAQIAVEEGSVVPAGRRLAVLELPEIDAAVAKAEAGAAKARRDWERARALYADSVVTREQLENAETGQQVAQSDLQAARFNQRYASITAPATGIVLRRFAEPGQLVGPGTPVVLFGAASKGQVVRVGVPDRDIVRLSVGDPAEVAFDAYPGGTWTGRVARLGAAAAPGAGTYEVEILLDEPVTGPDGTAALASGLVGDVSIRPSRAQSVRLVPVIALLEGDGDRATVWSLDAGRVPRRHAVRVAFLDGGRAALSEGLDGVDRIVADGAAYLTETSRVRVADGQ